MPDAVAGPNDRLPTFVGIGAPKAGTTWLCRLLESHPDVAMSSHRKEVHYFDLHHDRGLDWYRRFFPSSAATAKAVGEFTPHYLYDEDAPGRIHSVPSIERLILIVRNPVERAYSHYRFRMRQDGNRMSFEEFLDGNPDAVGWGRYGMHVERWLDTFDRARLLVLVFEHATADAVRTRQQLAAHLGLDAGRFPADLPPRANESFVPRRGRLYSASVRRARWLRTHDLDPVITAARRLGLGRALKQPDDTAAVPPILDEQRRRLWDTFEPDVEVLERRLGVDLSVWRETVDAA